MLIEMRPAFESKSASGLVLPATAKESHDTASIIAKVVAQGADCYKDESRCSQPWCKVGDWVLIRSYSGTRIKVSDTEYRLVNDDTIEAVVPDPDAIERI